MLKKGAIFIITVLLGLSGAFATERGGYFDIQNGSEYLGFSSMSKEFQISSLMNSAIANDAKATKIFIASGADINQKNLAGATALHLAARNNSFESAQILIENGARINEKDNEGWTPLMRASLAGNTKIMQLLIENGAQIWVQNIFGETALIHTAMADCYECGKLIVNDNMPNNYLTRNQVKQALEIVNKRYNEPFIKLLSQYANTEIILTLDSDKKQNIEKDLKTETRKDIAEGGSIIQLIYKFTGRTSSTDKTDSTIREKEPKKSIILNMDENTQSDTTKYKLIQNGSKITVEKPINIEKEQNTKTVLEVPSETTKYKLTPNGSKLTIEKDETIKTKKTEPESKSKKPAAYNFIGTKQEPIKITEEDRSTRDPKKYKLNPILLKIAIKKEQESSMQTETNERKNYSFNSEMEEKKKNMKLINNNDKLNPDNLNYKLQSGEKPLNN